VQHMQRARVRLQQMRLCNECETGDNECARCNECGQGVQRMRTAGATNADRGATDADGNKCSKWGATNARTGATNARTGATDAKTGCNGCFTRCNECESGCNGCGNECDDGCNECECATNATSEQRMLDRGCANCASGRGVRVTRIRSGGGRECYRELITCWKTGEQRGNQPKECIEGVSK
jgi:hypothetical protein